MSDPAAVLFDIDGTLITTGGAGGRSWRRATSELYGTPADISAFTDEGMTDPTVARLTYRQVHERDPEPAELAQLTAAYLRALPGEIETSEGYRVLDGVEEVLDGLAARGVLLGVVTGALEAAAHIKLGRAGLGHCFPFGGYGSDSADRAELTRAALRRAGQVLGGEVDPAAVLVVGDTPRDIEAALAVGAVAVGVASHHYTAEQLAEAGAHHVLGSLREPLPDVAAP
jgi:phosphoglycolate phosphatase-like HAD superfamily hydrolase